ncbi:sigma-70 family RNA polymerase sigma factor [Paenibacillus daejeonensis]|uniref:sigma-70 family RNA polymerase sigma factor n=1 Tax=Paenibacillus daejeonensis TaxID=135193 RepID=UPI00037D75C3|nr:sigma-70 family RNA polymerase sigma factor [Paenibacillus daejeonensis]
MKTNDTNFIRRLQRHKPDALDYIVDSYLPLVKGTIIKVLGPLRNDGLIDECINDSFLSVWQHADSFRGNSEDFRKWIYAIARFKAIDAYRKQVRRQAQVAGDTNLDILQTASAEQELLLAEEQADIIQLLHQLSETDRDIFTMKYLLGMRTDDIAAKLGLTRTAVDNRVFRGKKKLQEKAHHMGLGGYTV